MRARARLCVCGCGRRGTRSRMHAVRQGVAAGAAHARRTRHGPSGPRQGTRRRVQSVSECGAGYCSSSSSSPLSSVGMTFARRYSAASAIGTYADFSARLLFLAATVAECCGSANLCAPPRCTIKQIAMPRTTDDTTVQARCAAPFHGLCRTVKEQWTRRAYLYFPADVQTLQPSLDDLSSLIFRASAVYQRTKICTSPYEVRREPSHEHEASPGGTRWPCPRSVNTRDGPAL